MSKRPKPPDEVFFPVVPMLDMAFQLLAFFILTFRGPTGETPIDLELPNRPIALPGAGAEAGAMAAPDQAFLPAEMEYIETNLRIRARAGREGELAELTLSGAPVRDVSDLEDRLRRYRTIIAGTPLKVALSADDELNYEAAAQVLGACSSAGVDAINLSAPESDTQER